MVSSLIKQFLIAIHCLLGLLKASVEEYIEELKQRLSAHHTKEREIEGHLRQVNEEKMNHQREMDVHNQKIRRLQGQAQQLNSRINRIRHEDQSQQPPDIAALEEEVETRKEILAVMSTNLEEQRIQIDKVENEYNQVKTAFETQSAKLLEKRESIEPLEAQLQTIENGIKNAKSDIAHYNKKKQEYEAAARAAQEEIGRVEEKVADRMAKAMIFSKEKIVTRRKVDVLRREIVSMEEALKQQEASTESAQVVGENYKKLKSNFTRAEKQLQTMGNTIAFLAQSLETRKKGFKKIRSSTCSNVNQNFCSQLNARKYIGTLIFNHKDKTMTIQVNPNNKEASSGLDVDRDIRSLSGGEKSYSSVSLILALWQSMTPPFRVLDEFDVFMDTINRKIAISNILNFARMERKDQFIFLTPLGTDNIDTDKDDIRIIKLKKIANN